MKNLRPVLWIVLVIALVLLLKLFVLDSGNTSSKKTAFNPMAPVAVTVYSVSYQNFSENIYAAGTVNPREQVTLVSEINGKISKIYFNEGDFVTAGTLLIKINDSELQAQLKKINLLAENLKKKLLREQAILQINGISKEDVEATETSYNTALVEIELLNAQIEKTNIKAPFSGTTGLRHVSEGSFVTSNTALTTLVQLDPVLIDFSVPEQYADYIEKNDSINFRTNFSNERYVAFVSAVNSQINKETRTLAIRAQRSNKTNTLLPGTFVKVQLPIQHNDSALLIPTECIVPVLKGKTVFVCKNGVAKETSVVTGVRTEKLIQIISGLTPGDSVIMAGVMQVRNGSLLKIVNGK